MRNLSDRRKEALDAVCALTKVFAVEIGHAFATGDAGMLDALTRDALDFESQIAVPMPTEGNGVDPVEPIDVDDVTRLKLGAVMREAEESGGCDCPDCDEKADALFGYRLQEVDPRRVAVDTACEIMDAIESLSIATKDLIRDASKAQDWEQLSRLSALVARWREEVENPEDRSLAYGGRWPYRGPCIRCGEVRPRYASGVCEPCVTVELGAERAEEEGHVPPPLCEREPECLDERRDCADCPVEKRNRTERAANLRRVHSEQAERDAEAELTNLIARGRS